MGEHGIRQRRRQTGTWDPPSLGSLVLGKWGIEMTTVGEGPRLQPEMRPFPLAGAAARSSQQARLGKGRRGMALYLWRGSSHVTGSAP